MSAIKYLKIMYGEDSKFREDQLESIESVVNGNKTLVVQKTGWGKSTVYFIATKILRERGSGVTILISPLLSLMRNQIESATKLGLNATTINSSNQEEWDDIRNKLMDNDVDILLISPERLGNSEFMNQFMPFIGRIGLFVVDEAHCISDWGHDFRPDYQRIISIIKTLPINTPVLATTATSNDRVVEDIKNQLGDLSIIRGSLTRDSLHLQVIQLGNQAERLAWLAKYLNILSGSGIIYCLTISDCNKVAEWLQHKGINALPYHSSLHKDKEVNKQQRIERENKLLSNEVKALVATVALGMGFDKPDLSFVIHFQRPGSVVSYYQQIGRAGRALDKASVILLSGNEDDEIQEYFIKSAFPTEVEIQEVVDIIEEADYGVTLSTLTQSLNMSSGRITKCLKKLVVDNIITKEKSTYYRTANPFDIELEKSKAITDLRYIELDDMRNFVLTKKCYMKYIANKLDDTTSQDCEKCANCTGKLIIDSKISDEEVNEAVHFLRESFLTIKVKKMWPANIVCEKRKKITLEELNEEGRVLSVYGDAGWGHFVKDGKYEDKSFNDDLVKASAKLINEWEARDKIEWVTFIPSLRRPNLVKDFAERLAKELNLPIYETIKKTINAPEQKTLENSFYQCRNAFSSFEAFGDIPSGSILLVDDMIDSGWTLTVCGALLRREGVEAVYPFALASTSKNGV